MPEQKLLFQVNDPKIPFYNSSSDDITAEARALITKKRRYKLSARPELVIDEKKDDQGKITGYTIKDNKKKRTFKVKESGTGDKTKWTISVYQREAKKKDSKVLRTRYASDFEKETVLIPFEKELQKLGYDPKRIKAMLNKAFKKLREDLNTCYSSTDDCMIDQFVEKKIAPIRTKIQTMNKPDPKR